MNNRYPGAGDEEACLGLAKALMEANQAASGDNFTVDIEGDVFNTAVAYSACSISPMAAFYGGIIAQEMVKYTGKYSPLKQWLHFDIYETLPKADAGAVNREP